MIKHVNTKISFKFILTSLAIIFTVLISTYLVLHKDDNLIIAWVDGHPIMLEEMDREINDGKIAAVKYFEENYQADAGKSDFWSNHYKGLNPSDYLKEKSLKSLETKKVQQILAKNNRIITHINYRDFVIDFNKIYLKSNPQTNNSNTPAMNSNTMYRMAMSDIVAKTLDKLSKKDLAVSDSEIQTEYITNKDTSYSKFTKDVQIVSIRIIDNNFNIIDAYQINAIKILTHIKNEFDQKVSFDQIKKEYSKNTDPKVLFNEKSYNDFVITRMKSQFPGFLGAVDKLKVGETSGIIDDSDGNLSLIKCVGYKKEGYIPLEEIKKTITRNLINKKYEALINIMLKAAKIKINEKVFNKYQVK